jgi:predicted phosphoribosyltransferase/pimeloyl-ACP methyl ester carboxylesterase
MQRNRSMNIVREEPVRIPIDTAMLAGDLRIPPRPRGLVLFAHGSGSSRHSRRNRRVAAVLEHGGFATLLMDLLTEPEEAVDLRTSHMRFDIGLLADRLVQTTDWIAQQAALERMPVAYFGASTGAAAALVAAAQRPDRVRAVVSRGGRPDLAMDALPRVTQPTLLIVGGADLPVIELNRQALGRLRSEKRLEIVPHATHLFEEPGALEEVARLARSWFDVHLAPGEHATATGRAAVAYQGRFRNREHAGQVLARALTAYRDRPDVLVLALPRGGVPVAFEVARELRAPLDVFLVRKLGVPGHEEFAFGAIASGEVRVLNDEVVRRLEISPMVVEAVARHEGLELERRERAYRGGRPAPDIRGRTIILVDDGLATGASMRAAALALRREGAARIVAAVPAGSRETCEAFRNEVDEVVCATTPQPFFAVGLSYEDFSQTTDDEVQELLQKAKEWHQRAA